MLTQTLVNAGNYRQYIYSILYAYLSILTIFYIGNLDIDEGYFSLCFITKNIGNLDANLSWESIKVLFSCIIHV